MNASQVWNPQQKGLIGKIERIQRSFTKRMTGQSEFSYTQRMENIQAVSLEKRRLHLDLIFVYKLVHGHFDMNVNDFFEFRNSAYNTRGHRLTLVWQNCNKSLTQSFITNRVIGLWNDLPEAIVCAPTISKFKELLHTSTIDTIITDSRKGYLRGGD